MAVILGGASVTSKRPGRMLTTLRAVGANRNKVKLEDGRWYTDWQMGLHGALFGYRPKWWSEALVEAARTNIASSIACEDERVVAGMLEQFYPDIEAVRFMCNGSDPCAAAVKLARAATGRSQILVYGYHGTSSAYAAPPEASNRPNHPAVRKDLGTLQAERDAYLPLEWRGEFPDNWAGIAAVIIECPPVDGGQVNAEAWLKALSFHAEKHGALFILDEVVTGFRYGPGGAAGYYGIQGLVDLYCFGKTLGNGYPVAALGGRYHLMEQLIGTAAGMVHMSGTFYGDPIGMAAAKATLKQLATKPPWEKLYNIGQELIHRWNGLSGWPMVGHPTRPVIKGGSGLEEGIVRLRRGLFNRGHIFCDHPIYVSVETTSDDVASLCDAVEEVCS